MAADASPEDSTASLAPSATLDESRRRVLDIVCRFSAAVAVPICSQQVWVNARLGRWDLVSFCVVIGAILIALTFTRSMSYRHRALALCVLMGGAAAGAWLLAGFVLDSAAVHLTAILLAALLLGRRASTIMLVVLTAVYVATAYLRLHGHLPTDPQIEAAGHEAQNWVTGGTLLAASALILGSGLPIVFGAVERARRDAVQLASRLALESEARLEEIKRREETQRQLVAAQRRDALALLAGGLAHDFNNLLTVVYAAFEQAEQEVRPGGPASDALVVGRAAADSTAALTRQLLAYSRGDPHGKVPTDLSPLLRQTTGLIRRLLPSNIDLRMQAPHALPPVTCAPTQIQQVLINLAINARDAMPDGGRIEITARADETAVELRVSDTGTGIDPAIADRIFEPLFSTKEVGKGTGLGLSVVSAVIADHGGTVTVRSEPGAGATFEVRVPRASVGADAARPAAEVPPVAGTRRLLVVDDEEGVRLVVARALRARGYDVTVAESADQASQMIAAQGPPDLVVTDLSMPGTHGAVFARAVLGAHARVRVLIVSGYSDEELADIVATGRARVLPKPFTAQSLMAAVDDLFEMTSSRAGR